MITFEELYRELIKRAVHPNDQPLPEHDPYHLECLLYPEKQPPVLYTHPCSSCEDPACRRACIFDAIVEDENGGLTVDASRCMGCSACIEACENGALTGSRDILPAMKAVREAEGLSYAIIAPAFLGQFPGGVTPGQLRSAFKAVGFDGMVEVALFADILTLKEALEFDHNIQTNEDFQLTSCCCPLWLGMIRKVHKELMPHVPGAVSPMVACGRVIKQLHPDAVVVFIGPCLAKKVEAREADVADAVDYVLTFQEVQDIFSAVDVRPEELEESERDHSSRAGRIYARSGGVSEAVRRTVEQLHPDRAIQVQSCQADGIVACRTMIDELRAGNIKANFFEGMGCVGGCVGGPKAILDREQGRDHVETYGDNAQYATPLENPYVLELLQRLGFDTVEQLLEESKLFTRQF